MLTLLTWKYTYVVCLKGSQAGFVSGNSFTRSVVVLMRVTPVRQIDCVILQMPKKHRFEI